MNFLRKLENLHNKASDTAFVWFPFLWLKPKTDQMITIPKTILMSLVFGIYYGAFYCLKNAVFSEGDFFKESPRAILIAITIFFVWFNAVTAPLWNRRAKKHL